MTKKELKNWMWQWLSPYADQYKFMDEFDEKLDEYAQSKVKNLPISDVSGRLCDGCNVRGNWEHRCHGEGCNCDNPVCMKQQGRITHEKLMEIVNRELNGH